MKKCTCCSIQKPLTDFGTRPTATKGLVARSRCYACMAVKRREARKANPEKEREVKRRYYASEKGRASKKREDAAFIVSGGRAKAEQKRAMAPLSPARRKIRKDWARNNKWYSAAWQANRRCSVRKLDPCDFWILQEAMKLARLRESMVGGMWHVDHVTPVSLGGTSEPHNIQVVPAIWNQFKSNVHTERFFGAERE